MFEPMGLHLVRWMRSWQWSLPLFRCRHSHRAFIACHREYTIIDGRILLGDSLTLNCARPEGATFPTDQVHHPV